MDCYKRIDMKRYIKDGQIKFHNQIVLHGTRTFTDNEGKERTMEAQIFNPTEDMLLEHGWVEYVEPAPEEPTEEELLDMAKESARREIEDYDSSDDVNGFYMQGQQMWLDKATRAGLMLRLQAEQATGNASTTLWYGSHQFEIPMEQAFQMLYALEVYASQCYDNTQRHLAAVDGLMNYEEVAEYDYSVGYPEKLEF